MARVASQSGRETKPRGRPPANLSNKVTKPSQRGGRRTSAGAASRQVLQEKSNNESRGANRSAKAYKTITDEADPLDDEDAMSIKPTRGRPKISNNVVTNGASNGENISKPKRGRPPKARASTVEEDAETQPTEAMAVDEEELQQASQELEPTMDAVDEPGELCMDSDSDDASLRRRLRELTKRYKGLEARYGDLRDVGVKDAERNYDQLKKQSEENSAAASKLISELRAELSIRSSLAKKLELSEAKCDSLAAQATELSTSLSDARSEIKTLSTKLAAARNAEANIKVPGSALKSNGAGNRAPAVEVVQAAQAKEDLYGDLTGLIVRGMKHGDKEDIFDCIQTGRNGTLHFKLALDTADRVENYEDVQYTYRPQLDPNRDGDLQLILPDYLLEEITFPRPHASKFFSRVTKSLTEKVD